MKESKKIQGKPVNFILNDENQELLKEYEDTLSPGAGIKPSMFYNDAVKQYLMALLQK
jgi:hypothetical protein